jgi:hypothetical protein
MYHKNREAAAAAAEQHHQDIDPNSAYRKQH